MDILCRRCEEPWEVAYLRHEVAWHVCQHGRPVERWSDNAWHHRKVSYFDQADQCHGANPQLRIEPADNQQVPPEVAEVGEQGWYQFVAKGLGCPACYGRADRQHDVQLTAEQLDEFDAATEGEFSHLLL